MEYQEIQGDLIELALKGRFDVIAHGCNCFCTMGAGIAPKMANAFGCDTFPKENLRYKGNIDKLGTIDFMYRCIEDAFEIQDVKTVIVVNAYTQYYYGKNHFDGVSKPIDYEALTLCMRKINHIFKGKHIGLSQIGCGLAGGDWNIVKSIIQKELKDCKVTIVIYNK